MAYWKDRMSAAQNAVTAKRRREIEKQIKKYYKSLARKVIDEYEGLYNELLLKKSLNENISPATLYSLDKYWSMQTQLRKHLNKTGAYLTSLYTKLFELTYKDSYNAINIKGLTAFNTIDDYAIETYINTIWAADGKSWSDRVWNNTNLLGETLNEELIHCVVAGKKTTDLKKLLQDRFNVSYHRASTLARTEMAHIQTEAAKKRYADYGLEQVEIWADPDERTCKVCGKLHKQKYPVGANVPIPAHPNCRCCIIPVINND
jgi:SPP1 gp7 family putative phage head morphogenesis protein